MHARYAAFALIVILLPVLSALVDASQATDAGGSNVAAAPITISGKVTDSEGGPIAGATVTIYRSMGGASTALPGVVDEKNTGADGTFALVVPAGMDSQISGLVVARKQGFSLGWVPWRVRGQAQVQITLGEPKDLAGEVVDENGQPVADATVHIAVAMLGGPETRRSLAVPSFLRPRTDVNGRFVFANMPAEASFEFTIEKPGRATIGTLDRTTYRGGKYQFAPGQAGIKLTLPAEARLEGVVVEKAGGKPVGGVRVVATPDVRLAMLLSPQTATTAPDGTFRIGTLTSGTYVVQLQAVFGEMAEWTAEPLSVTVSAGQIRSDLQLQLTKGGIIEVLVKDNAGGLVAGATVNLRQVRGDLNPRGRTDEQGLARIRVPPGSYVLSTVYKEGYTRRMVTQVRASDQIEVAEGEIQRIEYVLNSASRIAGIVRDESGNPLAGVKLSMTPMGLNEATSDASGRFDMFRDAMPTGLSDAAPVLVARDVARNLAGSVEIDEQAGLLDLKLQPGLTFTGTLVTEEGKPPAEGRVLVLMRGARLLATLNMRDPIALGPNGAFEVKAIPPDRQYTIMATAQGYGKQTVQVDPGDIKDNRYDAGPLKLPLANLTVAGVVVDANDQPVAGAHVSGFGENQPDMLNTSTDTAGRFTIKGVCAGLIRLNVSSRGPTRMSGLAQTEGGTTDLRIVVSSRPTAMTYMPRRPSSLKGKPLPELKNLGINPRADAEGKMLLVCLWDMGQRPSRNCLTQLAAQAAQLREKGVEIVAVHAAEVEDGALSEWIEKNTVPFKAARLTGDIDKTKFAWGVASLPHLILTDKKHAVVAEGFSLDDLNKQIEIAAGQ